MGAASESVEASGGMRGIRLVDLADWVSEFQQPPTAQQRTASHIAARLTSDAAAADRAYSSMAEQLLPILSQPAAEPTDDDSQRELDLQPEQRLDMEGLVALTVVVGGLGAWLDGQGAEDLIGGVCPDLQASHQHSSSAGGIMAEGLCRYINIAIAVDHEQRALDIYSANHSGTQTVGLRRNMMALPEMQCQLTVTSAPAACSTYSRDPS
ncbi:hypothetical protein JKP88DRAFT_285798 [Tribonema minus]|uniref:Uncharacterized protein n=1 Tax=Tribonema minus TaxID=303371 RepID=A0A836CLF3_9STRA|nr:hypothetical protein JKP88DRAFT_285798 [Tribonema minus]